MFCSIHAACIHTRQQGTSAVDIRRYETSRLLWTGLVSQRHDLTFTTIYTLTNEMGRRSRAGLLVLRWMDGCSFAMIPRDMVRHRFPRLTIRQLVYIHMKHFLGTSIEKLITSANLRLRL
jgi:hypothetical protein